MMKKRLIALLLVLVTMLGMLPGTALAADTEEEALGEVNIFNGGYEMYYLSMNGRVRKQSYTYFNYVNSKGETKEIPAYCVNPTTKGVPQTVSPGQSIKYLAKEKGSDPKVMGIIANGYPTRGLSELKLENKYQAFYATKMALWCYLIPDWNINNLKVNPIIANGYPTRGLSELKLENKYQAFYATKMALWCYLIPDWNINNLKVNPNLTGKELQRAQAMLAAAKDIYARGTTWSKILSPRVMVTPDRDTAYSVTVDGQRYQQQIFTVNSDTWVCNYIVKVSFTDPSTVPAGTRIVDMDNKDITAITTSNTGGSFAGKFKVLYPASAVAGKTGSVQLSFSADVYKYAVFYATCAETGKYGQLQNYMCDTDPASAVAGKTGSVQLSFSADVYKYAVFYATCAETGKYGQLQNYMCDTDPTVTVRMSAYSNYTDDGDTSVPDTGLKITKLEKGTDTPLSGAVFEVVDPEGATIGTFSTGSDGTITIPLTLSGNYTVYERVPPRDHLLSDTTVQNIKVEYGKVAEATFWNEPYGTLHVEKLSDTGAHLPGAVVQIKHIESGTVYSAETNFAGYAIFDNIKPGAYEIREITAPSGWLKDDATYTTTVTTGETATFSLVNKELPGLRIIKYDRKTMEAMPDVTFEIFRDSVSLGKFRTDEFGEILLTNVKPGTYRAVEVDTGSDGHILDTTPQEVELSAGDGIKELLFFNDVKPGLRLVKVDSADPSRVIPNAVFEIKSVDGSFGPEEFTTDENGEIDLSKLPAGAYVVTEKACEGYIINQAQRIIQLDPNEDAQFVFTNTIKPSLQIIKTSSDGSRLKNVTFRIAKIEDGTHYLDRTTNEQGEIVISGLEPGVYSVKETATDASHILDVREYHMELFPGKTSTLTVENQKRPNLIVYKHDADTGEPVADTVFEVRAADGHSVDQIKTDKNGKAELTNLLPGVYEVTEKSVPSPYLDQIKTDKNGKAELTNLLPGVYEVTEKSVPSPYLLDAPKQLVTLYPNRDHTIYFENHKKPSLTVKKVDSVTGDVLQGAKFQVTYASNNTGSGEINDLGTFYTDENGQFQLTGLRDGWYKVTELEPPTGYAIKEAVQEVYIQSGTSKTLTFENIPLSALVVWKYDSVTGEAVEGAVFQVKYLAGTSGTGGTVIGTYKTSANGSFTVTGLKEGTYIVEELASDSGHVIDTAPQTAYISGKQQDVVQLYFGNSPKGSLLVKKIDSVTREPLSDVEFMVTTSDGTVVGDANGKFVTDSAGSFTVSGIDPGITLVVKETRTKAGYVLDDTPQTVKIQAGQTVTLEFRNQPKGSLIIVKKDAVTGEPLKGVTFKVTTSSGEFVPDAEGQISSNGLYYTDENGQIVLSGLAPDTYVVTETASIPGYVLDSTPQTVVVNTNDTQTLTFTNTPVGSGQIIKVDAESGKRIKGVRFEIAKMNGEWIGTYTTDSDGVITLPELSDGWYTATELKAAKGYLLDSTPHNFEVKNGKTTSLTIENAKASSILIHKIDSVTGKGIYGVTFLVSDSRGNPVGQYTSDQNGYVYIDKSLTDGKYQVREIEAADGYLLDTTVRTFYVEYGGTSTITWKNTPVMGQIQITKRSVDDNPYNAVPAGSPLPGATFEIYNRAGNLVNTVVTDKNGIATSDTLPLGRYTIRETKAPMFYSVDSEPVETEIEFSGQIVRVEVLNKSVYTNVSVTKRGYKQVVPAQTIRYDFKNIANNSTVPLNSFYWRDTLPASAVRLTKIVTGTWNQKLSYKVVYKTNLHDYRTLADNLSTMKNYSLPASAVRLTKIVTGTWNQKLSYKVVYKTNLHDYRTLADNLSTMKNYSLDASPARLTKIVTGTWNQKLSYKVVYKTNLHDYRTLADNLSTMKNYSLDASPAALGLASNEYVTDFMFVFGTVKAGFAQVDAPYIFCWINSWLNNGYQFANRTDVGGLHDGQWIMATDRWVTTIYKAGVPKLPKTGY